MTHDEHNSQAEQNIKRDVIEYGWSVCLFEADSATPSFGYTIGLWQNFSHPEIICFGLPINTLHRLLNDAGELVRNEQRPALATDNYEILDKVPVQFRAVDESNISDYFGYGQWFYQYQPFSAVQLIWPDKAGVFPWQPEFDKEYEYDQPLLEQRLDFKFFEARNTATYVAKQIFKEGRPILRAVHEEDGDWQFLTGEIVTADDIMIVTLEQVVKRDETVNNLFNLPRGYLATRESREAKWRREAYTSSNEEE